MTDDERQEWETGISKEMLALSMPRWLTKPAACIILLVKMLIPLVNGHDKVIGWGA
jgi:hypothetical protein